MPITAIVDYNSGNLHSAHKSFEHVANQLRNERVIVSRNPKIINSADRIILPGVGAFADCKNGINSISGLFETLYERVIEKGKPFLGICVGHQMLATFGYEHGKKVKGLNWIEGNVISISTKHSKLKVPHIGWNSLCFDKEHELFKDIKAGEHAYFTHSYHLVPKDLNNRICHVDYGYDITASVQKDNIVGTQFHPEKSQQTGLKFISNFLSWRP